jgi:hypothetical protein
METMTGNKEFEFVIVETATYRISAKGKTVQEAARAAGAEFGADPLRFSDSVEDRTVFTGADEPIDVTTEFDAGIAGDAEELTAEEGHHGDNA